MRDIVIQPERGGKGRTFRSILLAHVEADHFWSGGGTAGDTIRPVWAQFAGSDNELRAFAANLTSGRKAIFPGRSRGYSRKEDRVEFLRSVGYQTAWQRETEGSLFTIYLPELFQQDPGMVDPEALRFILLPSSRWHTEQELDVSAVHRHLKRCGHKLSAEQVGEWTPLSYLFAAYLDRRTRCPLVMDGGFYAQLMIRCLADGLATFSATARRDFGVSSRLDYKEHDTQDVGLKPGLAFLSSHERFEQLLAEEVTKYFDLK